MQYQGMQTDLNKKWAGQVLNSNQKIDEFRNDFWSFAFSEAKTYCRSDEQCQNLVEGVLDECFREYSQREIPRDVYSDIIVRLGLLYGRTGGMQRKQTQTPRPATQDEPPKERSVRPNTANGWTPVAPGGTFSAHSGTNDMSPTSGVPTGKVSPDKPYTTGYTGAYTPATETTYGGTAMPAFASEPARPDDPGIILQGAAEASPAQPMSGWEPQAYPKGNPVAPDAGTSSQGVFQKEKVPAVDPVPAQIPTPSMQPAAAGMPVTPYYTAGVQGMPYVQPVAVQPGMPMGTPVMPSSIPINVQPVMQIPVQPVIQATFTQPQVSVPVKEPPADTTGVQSLLGISNPDSPEAKAMIAQAAQLIEAYNAANRAKNETVLSNGLQDDEEEELEAVEADPSKAAGWRPPVFGVKKSKKEKKPKAAEKKAAPAKPAQAPKQEKPAHVPQQTVEDDGRSPAISIINMVLLVLTLGSITFLIWETGIIQKFLGQ